MLKIGIIGCGKQADAHAVPIQELSNCEIVGVCDSEELMAKQLYERFEIKKYYNDINKFLAASHPDIVHVTTPPQSHFAIGKLCIEAGCNIFFEKPLALNSTEVEGLIKLATENDVKITVGHNNQFGHAARRMRKLVQEGYLGGTPVHMESIWCYDLGDPAFAKALFSDKTHWVRTLPGKLLHNNISHGICKIAEFLAGNDADVVVHGFTSKLLKSIDENDIVDELRVIISDSEGTTAYFTFSTQMKPVIQQFRIYGPESSLIIDDPTQTVFKLEGNNYKSYLKQFIAPLNYAKQYAANSGHNMKKFVMMQFHYEAGRKDLIEKFYNSVLEGKPLPISYKEIILTSKIMDKIFKALNKKPN